MHSQLAQLLNLPENKVNELIDELERLSGYHSEDVRLITDIRHQTNQKLIDLGLDPADTVGEEFYYALLARARSDNQAFNREIGFNKLKTQSARNRRLAEFFKRGWQAPETWSLKPVAAKKLLRSNPPKKLMKSLNYSSLESLIKREDPKVLLAIALQLESNRWQSAIQKAAMELPAGDFGLHKIQIFGLPAKTSQKLDAAPGIWLSSLMGSVVYQASEEMPLLTMLNVETAVRTVREAGASIKNQHFGSTSRAEGLEIGNVVFGWGAVLEHYDKVKPPAELAASLPLEKLYAAKTLLDRLSAVTSQLAWWTGNIWLGVSQEKRPVSLNLIDALTGIRHDSPYKKRPTAALEAELPPQLLSRYLNYGEIEAKLMEALNAPAQISEAEFASPEEEFGELDQKVEWA